MKHMSTKEKTTSELLDRLSRLYNDRLAKVGQPLRQIEPLE